MLLAALALTAAALFSGAALYVNIVEQPARLLLDDGALLTEWKRAYALGTRMRAPLAVIGFLLGAAAAWRAWNWQIGAGALSMLANIFWTFLVIAPVNRWLKAADPRAPNEDVRALAVHWARLHAVRTFFGFAAIALILWGIAAQ